LTFYNEKKIIVAIILGNDNTKFPEMLFSNAIKKFETAFNVIVDFSISYKSNLMTTTAMRRELQEQKPNSSIVSIKK
jgi:hypothetical protein